MSIVSIHEFIGVKQQQQQQRCYNKNGDVYVYKWKYKKKKGRIIKIKWKAWHHHYQEKFLAHFLDCFICYSFHQKFKKK